MNIVWLRRNRKFVEFTLASLLRRKGRNLSLLLVYGLVVFVLASVLFFGQALRSEAEALLQDAPQMVVQRMTAGRHDLIPLDRAPALAEIAGVRKAEGRLWGYYFHPASKANYTVIAKPGFAHGDEAVAVGSGVSRTWIPAGAGELYMSAFDGRTLVFRVAEVLPETTELVAADCIVLSEGAFRRLFGMPEGMATDLVLHVRNTQECPVIAGKVTRLFPDSRAILREDILRTYSAVFDLRSGYVVVILAMSGLAFFIFAWDKATGLSAQERSEIGVLKALGWDTSDVLLMKFWEGAVISLTAFLAGVLLAYLHVFLADATVFEHALKGWGVLYPKFRLQPETDMFMIATLFFFTVAPYSLVTLIPTWQAATADPDAVMRQI
jgi:predicted lysophospholipase L1 biosynthesis ABC-type transport system permease subunit